MEELLKIKKLLPKLTSSDLELLIVECSKRLRIEEYYDEKLDTI